MDRSFNVLVVPGATEIGIEIGRALGQTKEVRLFSAGVDASGYAPYAFKHHFTIPSVNEPGWLEELNILLSENGIDYIYPAHDDVVLALALNQETLRSRVVTSPLETCRICRSKRKTYELLSGAVPTPAIFEDIASIREFPVFVKPDKGQGSQHASIARDTDELTYLLRQSHQDFVVTEHLPHEEYTIDCFSDREHGLLFVGGRERVRTRAGISMCSRPVQHPAFTEYAQEIAARLTFHGAWFFQVKGDRSKSLKLLEVAPRVAGTMALNRVQGINFPLLSIYEQERMPVRLHHNGSVSEIERALVNRYRPNTVFSAVYVDLDDTLIFRGAVNTLLIRLLYQFVNEGKKVFLLTKHSGDVTKTLQKFRLVPGLFDEIIQIAPDEHKADYIKSQDAILIDDSFSERMSISERSGISTFDLSMIEQFIDDRV